MLAAEVERAGALVNKLRALGRSPSWGERPLGRDVITQIEDRVSVGQR